MNTSHNKKSQDRFSANTFLKSLLVSYLVLLAYAAPAQAAKLYFDPSERIVGIGSDFKVGLLVDSLVPINAMEIDVDIPAGLEAKDVSDGDTVINLWLEKPDVTQSGRKLSFSGIVPGGYSGKGGRLAIVTFIAKTPGDLSLSYSPISRLIRNDPESNFEPVEIRDLVISVDPGKQTIVNDIPDTEPPESFVPMVATSSDLYSGKNVIIFATQDKVSGIGGYFIAEIKRRAYDPEDLRWITLS